MSTQPASAAAVPRSLFVFSLIYGGLVCIAGVLGTKLASLGTWPVLGPLAVEAGIFAFLVLVVLSSAVAELHGRDMANKLVRYGFIPLILSMLLIQFVIHVPPAVFWHKQEAFEQILGQSSRMMLAGLIAYGVSQTLNVYIFSKLTTKTGSGLWLRALVAGLLSQIVDTLLFITIAFYGVEESILPILQGQIIAKLTLSVVMVPPLIYVFVALGRRLDAGK
ncbi:MAG TPA: queuosine precursor transporter [Allosphingosinicella sp.]|nr:queuosine precursor transporter [Allosphingosinicella sp.]